MADVNTRPNIRIEIKNNVNDMMDIDKEAINISEDEEGEIIDKNGEQEENIPNTDSVKFGDIWAKFDNHTTNTNTEIQTEMESVYTSLCVKELRNTVRLDAVHMRQNGEMNTLDILKYFVDYSPTAIEWIDEKSCNILWADQIPMAAKALYHLSKVIVGSKNDGTLEVTMDLDGQNNGLLNKHRIIEMKDDDKVIEKDTDKENREVHIRNIVEDIPEGTWRLGNECLKCKFILLRFALTIDKQPIRAEHFTEYYKQCGVIENGNNLGIISQSKKRKFQGIFDRNRDLTSGKHPVNKDPWGTLAESWNQDYAHTESEYKPTTLLTSKHLKSVSNLHHRLGFKHAHLELNESEQNFEDIYEAQGREILEDVIEVRSDLEDTIALTEHNNRELLETRLKHKVSKKKRSKIPRMRMYADEEEAKIKRKKSLQSLKKKKHAEEVVEECVDANDLRNMLGKRTILKPKRRMENVVLVIKQEPDEDKNTGRQMEDLGNKLKHRHLMRLSEAAAKNSVHLRSRGIHRMVTTAHRDEETYGMQAPVPEPLAYRHSETAATIREMSTARLVPRAATLDSDTIIKQPRLQSSTPMQQRRMNARSPDNNQQQFHYAKDLRSDRNHHQRARCHMDRDQRCTKYEGAARGKMHADREEYYQRRSGTRGDSGGNRRKYRKDMEEDEIEKVERKGAKSKVMVVVKKLQQPSVASMAILPCPSSTANQYPTQPTSISTSSLRHRRHDNVRLSTRDSNRHSPNSKSSNSSEEDDSSSSSSSSSSEDDNDDDDGSSSKSGSGSESDSESSDSSASVEITRGSSTVIRGGRGSIKDRVGIKKKDTQPGRLRVQIKNEHYGK